MTTSIQALREQLNARAASVRDLVEKNNASWSAEHQEKYDAGMSEVESLRAAIDRANAVTEKLAIDKQGEEIAERVARTAPSAAAGDQKAALWNAWLRGGDKALSAEDWRTIRNTMSTSTGSEGGYAVQTDVAARLLDQLKAFGGMRAVSTVISTDKGNDITFPTSDGTAEVGELIGQNTTATALDPTFGTLTHSVYKYSSKIVAVPYELLQDSQIDVEAFVRNRLAERLGRIQNAHFTTGSGTGQPRGAVTAAASGKVGITGQTTTVIADDLIDLVHSIDPAYRALGRCRFMMNDASLAKVRKLKDGGGRPILTPGDYPLSGPMSDSILGFPVTVNQDMANMAANAKSILFGDFSYYTIRDVMGMTMFRFEDSAYAKLGQVGFLAWMRTGGNLVGNGVEVKFYQNSAT